MQVAALPIAPPVFCVCIFFILLIFQPFYFTFNMLYLEKVSYSIGRQCCFFQEIFLEILTCSHQVQEIFLKISKIIRQWLKIISLDKIKFQGNEKYN